MPRSQRSGIHGIVGFGQRVFIFGSNSCEESRLIVAAIALVGHVHCCMGPDWGTIRQTTRLLRRSGTLGPMTVIHVYPPDDDDGSAALLIARDEQRRIRDGSTLVDPVDIVIHVGTYRIRQSIALTTADFGSVRAPVTWRSAGDGPVVLTGSIHVPMQRRDSGNVWTGQVPEGGVTGGLLDDNRWMRPARYPNLKPGDPWFGGWLHADEPPQGDSGNRRRFWCRDHGLTEFDSLLGAEVVVFPRANYRSDRRRIIDYDPETGEIQLDRPATYDVGPGQRFYIQSVSGVLDSPGEWRTHEQTGTIECVPIGPGNPSITIPGVRHIFDVQGSERRIADVSDDDWPYWDAVLRQIDPPDGVVVSHLTIRDLICEGTSDAAIKVESCAAVTIQGCTIRNCIGRGIRLVAGESCRISDCEVSQILGGGILVAGGVRRPFTAMSEPANHLITNCYIHHTGLEEKHSAAVAIAGVGNVCEHCLIHDVPRWGIHSRGNHHRLEYNHIRHLTAETAETAGIFLCDRDWQYRGTVIRYNRIHNIPAQPPSRAPDSFLPWAYGIYLDDWTSGVTIEGNIVSDTTHSGILIVSGHSNHVFNNIVHEAEDDLLRFQKWPSVYELERMGTDSQGFQHNRFERNILVSRDNQRPVYAFNNVVPEEESVSSHGNIWDHNLIWQSGKEVWLQILAPGQERRVGWDEWRTISGQDATSQIADPLLDDHWLLADESPAFGLGFQQLQVDQMGLQPSSKRSDWPPDITSGVREMLVDSKM
ncbi:MAG: right-handed parallel beta-helix repeat-containing protein [Thermomicrobiales bacterium]